MSNRPLLSMQFSIKKLRKKHPDWKWTVAERTFGGCEYGGRKGERFVKVYARAHVGQFEDDGDTTWYADEGGVVTLFMTWSIREQQSEPQPTAAS